MAATYSQYTGDGNQRDFTVTFPYIDKYHVKVYLDGSLTSLYSWFNSTTIRMDTAPAQGVDVLIRRETQVSSRLVNFTDYSLLNALQQNTDSNQAFFLLQELFENPPTVNGQPFMRGPQGDKGDTGGTGPTGPAGPQGPPGSDDVDLPYLLTTLTGQLTEDQLYQSLLGRIAKIDQNSVATEGGCLEDGIVQSLCRNTYDVDTGLWTVTVQAGDTAAEMTLAKNQWLVKLNGNGHVAGVGLLLDPYSNKSEFMILADMFKVVNPSLSTDKKQVFTVGTVGGVGTIGINGNLIIDGTVLASRIEAADLRLIGTGTITSANYAAPTGTAPGVGLKIDGPNGVIEAYGSGHAFGANLVTNDGTLMTSVGMKYTGLLSTHYPVIQGGSWIANGMIHLYAWVSSAWDEFCRIGVYSSGGNYFGIYVKGTGSLTHGMYIGDPNYQLTYGIVAEAGASNGVGGYFYGNASNGIGVIGYGGTAGYGGQFGNYFRPIRLEPHPSATGVPSHSAQLGTLYVDANGVLYINTSGSTTWAKVGAQ